MLAHAVLLDKLQCPVFIKAEDLNLFIKVHIHVTYTNDGNFKMATLLAPIFDLPAPVQQLTNLADAQLAQKFLNVQDRVLLKQNACCNLRHRSLSKTSLMSMANGWMARETRRKRHTGYDWAIIKLAVAGQLQALDIDTTFFSGNYPASAAVQACYAPDGNLDQAEWISIIENNVLGPSQHHICSDFSKADIYPCPFEYLS